MSPINVRENKSIVTLSSPCSNQDDLLVVETRAAVLVERTPTDSNMWRCSSAGSITLRWPGEGTGFAE